VVQTTLLNVWQARQRTEIRQPASYLARAVRWNAIKRQAVRAREVFLENMPVEMAPARTADDRLDALELERAIARLSFPQQTVIRLRFYLGLSFREISTRLEISKNTAASRTRYALANLRRLLTRDGSAPPTGRNRAHPS